MMTSTMRGSVPSAARPQISLRSSKGSLEKTVKHLSGIMVINVDDSVTIVACLMVSDVRCSILKRSEPRNNFCVVCQRMAVELNVGRRKRSVGRLWGND